MKTTQITNSMSFGHVQVMAQSNQLSWQNRNPKTDNLWDLNHEPSTAKPQPMSKGNLVEKAKKCILDNLTNSDFKVSDLAKALAYSQRQLERLIKKYTGFTIIKFIREIRLEVAYYLLKSKRLFTVSEVRYEVGFDHASYFNRVFEERYKIRPVDLLNS